MGAVSRRRVLALGAGAMAAGEAVAAEPSLDALARAKGLRFGTCLGTPPANASYRSLIARECGIIVPENELKLYVLKPEAEGFAFGRADALAAFAKDNGLLFRGHTLLWNHDRFAPKWILDQGLGPRPEQWLADYVRAVAGRYASRIQSWDVVNETIDPATGEQRDTVFNRALGPEAVEIAFRAAHAAAPSSRLAYNDYMGWGPKDAKHRAGVLKLLDRLKANGVPLHALGVQAHLNGSDAPTAQDLREWRGFLDAVRGMGLDLLITELDVSDTDLPADVAERDARVAAAARTYLDLMLDYRELKQVLVWGLADPYSWLLGLRPRPDKLPKRPTPYDMDLRPKPFREAIAAAFRAAPERTPWA